MVLCLVQSITLRFQNNAWGTEKELSKYFSKYMNEQSFGNTPKIHPTASTPRHILQISLPSLDGIHHHACQQPPLQSQTLFLYPVDFFIVLITMWYHLMYLVATMLLPCLLFIVTLVCSRHYCICSLCSSA